MQQYTKLRTTILCKQKKRMVKTAETYHIPVLLNESIDGLNIQPGGHFMLMLSMGGGGHSHEILKAIRR